MLNKRVLPIVLVLALLVPAPLELAGSAAGGASDGDELYNISIAAPAFLQLNLFWADGAAQVLALDLDQVQLQISDTAGLREVHENPIPVMPSDTVRVRVYGKSYGYSGSDILYDINYTSGVAGSYRILAVAFDTNELAASSIFVPVRVIFRPYDSTTGAGLPIEQFNITVQFQDQDLGSCSPGCYTPGPELPIGLGYIETYYGLNMTVRVRDYFGNLLYNETRVLRFDNASFCNPVIEPLYAGQCTLFSNAFQTWDLPLQVYSFKVYNQKPDQFVKVKLYWNGTGAGEEVFAPNSGLFPDWWDSAYTYRQRIRVNTTDAIPTNYTLNMSLASSVFAGKAQADYRDIRVVYWNGSTSVELNRSYNGTHLFWHAQGDVASPTLPSNGAWAFEEGTGGTTVDSSGYGGTGTLTNGPVWVTGRYGSGYALDLDGTNDYVSVPDSDATDLVGSALTLSAWVKFDVNNVQQGVIEKYDQTGAMKGGYALRLTSGGKLFGVTIDAAGAATTLTGATTVTTGVWHQVEYTYTGATHTLYLDGAVDATGANTRNPAATAVTLKLGARGDDAAATLNGQFDDPRLYNYARTAEQVLCDARQAGCSAITGSTTNRDYFLYYGNQLAGAPPSFTPLYASTIMSESGLLAYWPSNESSGTTLTNLQGTGNFALTNGPTLGVTSIVNTGVSFDGSNDYGQVTIDLNSYTKLTAEYWFFSSAYPASFAPILEYGPDYNNNAGRFGNFWDSSADVANGIFVGQRINLAGGNYNWKVAHASPGRWLHVVLQFDRTVANADQIRVFVNGTEGYAATRADGSIVALGTYTLNLGARNGGSFFLNGKVDDIALYNGLLTREQIVNHWQTGANLNASIAKPTITLDESRGFERFLSPGETAEDFLNPGYYEIQIVTDNRTGAISKANLGINITEANYVMVSGLNITRFTGDFTEIHSWQQIISNGFRPDVIHIGQVLPWAPTMIRPMSIDAGVDQEFERIHPFSVLEGTTAYTGAAGTAVALFKPNMSSESDDGSLLTAMTVKTDQFVFQGTEPALTHVWINYTNGTPIWENSTLPPSVTFSGLQGDVIVTTNRTVTTTRISDFRAIWEFSFRYYPTTRMYEASLSLNNSMNRTVLNPYWFVGFPENRSINASTASMMDLDNNAWLTKGQHFEAAPSGYYMTFDQLNASTTRHFFFRFWDQNSTDGQSTPILQVTEIQRETYQGSNAWWRGDASFVNGFTAAYSGDIVIKFTCPECSKIRMETLEIYDDTVGRKLEPTEFFAGAGSVTISRSAVGEVPVGGAKNFRVYFKLQLDPTTSEFTPYTPFLVIAGVGISLFLIIMGATIVSGVMLVITTGRTHKDKLRKQFWFAGLALGGLVTILLYIGRPGGLGFV